MTGTVDVDVDEGAGEPGSALPRRGAQGLAGEAHAAATAPPPQAAPEQPVPVPVSVPVPVPTSASAAEDDEDGDRLAVDEPLLAARAHRPSDLIRFVAGLLGIVAVFVIASIATQTTSGIATDIQTNVKNVAPWLTTVLGLVSTVAVLTVPLAFAVERLIKRDGLRVADGVLASVLAYGVTLAVDWWVAEGASQTIRTALTKLPENGGPITEPVHGYLAPVIAYMTAVGMVSRPRWRLALWSVVLLSGATELISNETTPLSLLLTVLIGWSVACGTLYAIGSPNIRPTGQHLMLGLRRSASRRATRTGHRTPPAAPGATSSTSRTAPRWTSTSSTASSRPPASSTGSGAARCFARWRCGAARSRCARRWSRRR